MFSEGEPERQTPVAWQPFTPKGIAAFATASTGRVLLAQSIFAAIVAAATIWFLGANYAPVITEAVRKLPDSTLLHNGQLHGASSQPLAKNRFLAVVIDLEDRETFGQTSDVQIELVRNGFNICSLLGCLPLAYPQTTPVSLGHSALEPWWGAWRPIILAFAGLCVVLKLFLSWAGLAAVYAVAIYVAGYFADREISLAGAWRLAAAALLPGALFLAFAIVFYGIGGADLIRLGLLFLLHFVVGWAYLAAGILELPRVSSAAAPRRFNPFVGAPGK